MVRTWLSTALAALAVSVGSGAGIRADGPAPVWNAAPAALPAAPQVPLAPPPAVKPQLPAPAPQPVTEWVAVAPSPAPAAPVPPPAPKPVPVPAPPVAPDGPEFRAIVAEPPPPTQPPPAARPAPVAVPPPPTPPPAPEFRPITAAPAVAPHLAPAPAPAVAPAPAPHLSPAAPSPELVPVAPAELPPAPVSPPPVAVAPPRQYLPSLLPALAVPPMPTPADEPKKADPMSEPLPPPRPVPTAPPPPEPGRVPPAVVVHPVAGTPVVDARPALDPAPNLSGTVNGVPVRGKVFGSPPVRLSRDFAARDFLGYDMADDAPGGRLFGGSSGGPPTDHYFVEAEYLLWWGNRPRIPVLATTSNNGGQGFLGQPGTVNLLGPGTFGPSLRDGLRVRAGGWLDDCSGVGFDASFFFLGRRTESVTFSGLPTLTRPFFAPNFNGEFGEVVALPNLSTGSLEVVADSFLWGADINYRCAVCRTCDRTSAWFVGYRHLNLAETLSMTEDITASGRLAPDPAGTRVLVGDRFRTHNRFHGGQVGYLIEQRYGRWEVGLRGSLALGVTVQTLEIDGFQRRTRPGQATQSFNGGLLATGPNLGRFDATRFSVVPEATVSLGYFVTPNVQLTFGYNFLYWNNVIRPGDQIDRTVDVSLVPNPPTGVPPSGQTRPLPTFTQSDFWAQGISFGARYRW